MKPPAPRRPAPGGGERAKIPAPQARAGRARPEPDGRPGVPSGTATEVRAKPAAPAPRPRPTRLARPIGQRDAAEALGPQQAATDLAPRREERERAKRSFYLRTLLLAGGGVLLLVALVWLLLFSPLLALDAHRIRVDGAQGTAGLEEAATAAAAEYEGVPLPRVPTARIAERIEENPAVADAEVRRAWPAGLEITLNLRSAAMVEASSGGFSLVDATGVAFQSASERPEGLPLVELPEGEERANAAEDVLMVWNALSETLRLRTRSVTADSKTLTLVLDSGASVKWGTPDDAALKSRVLEVLLSQRSASVYDVSSPAHPVIS